MRLSSRARYALRMMLDIGHYSKQGRLVSLSVVAERTGLSRGYLEQVAATLRSARLIRSVAGRSGGYRLARPAGKITVGDIIEATIGPVCLVDCIEEPDSCLRVEYCECRVVYSLINYRIREVLHGYTLTDLLDPSWINSVGGEVAQLTGIPVSEPPLGPIPPSRCGAKPPGE